MIDAKRKINLNKRKKRKRRNKMEEKKILDANGKEIQKKQSIEKFIPEDLQKKIVDKSATKKKTMNEFIQVSLDKAVLVKREQELVAKLINSSTSINSQIKFAFDKMKLNKDKEYDYKYYSDGRFVGTPKKKA